MILLSSNNGSIIAASIGIVLVLAGFFYAFIASKRDKNAKEEANKFLTGLADEFYKLMVKEIKEFNIEEFNFESIEDYQSTIMTALYDMIYDYTKGKIEEASDGDLLTALAIKMLDKETITKVAESVFENGDINGLIKDTWAKYFENKVKDIEDVEDISVGHDVEGNEIVYSGNEYNEDFDEKNDLPVVEEENIDQNDLSNIIPPSEDENRAFDEDLVMEGEPEKPYIKNNNIENPEDLPIGYVDPEVPADAVEDLPYFIDSKGRKRDKITGRFTK